MQKSQRVEVFLCSVVRVVVWYRAKRAQLTGVNIQRSSHEYKSLINDAFICFLSHFTRVLMYTVYYEIRERERAVNDAREAQNESSKQS